MPNDRNSLNWSQEALLIMWRKKNKSLHNKPRGKSSKQNRIFLLWKLVWLQNWLLNLQRVFGEESLMYTDYLSLLWDVPYQKCFTLLLSRFWNICTDTASWVPLIWKSKIQNAPESLLALKGFRISEHLFILEFQIRDDQLVLRFQITWNLNLQLVQCHHQTPHCPDFIICQSNHMGGTTVLRGSEGKH